jgi:hypothetical protein
VSRGSPCPICKSPDWCSVSADGALAACRRVEASASKSKTDRNGAPYYLHRLDGAARAPSAPKPAPGGPAPGRADPDTLHRVYDALIAALALSPAHRDNLRARGLSDTEIDRRGYRSLPVRGRAQIARELRERFGEGLLSVPGLVVKPGQGGRPYVTVAGAAGLLVPVRAAAGRIAALLVRRDGDGDGPRYSYLSSTRHGGPGPGAPVHVPLGVMGPAEVVRVTEGALKADVAHALSGLPTIGLPGVTTWRPALPALGALGARTVRLALDADARDKSPVARALAAAAAGLAAEGYVVELERWPAQHKGVDDALAAGAATEVLTGEAARHAIAEIVAEGTAGEPLPEPSPLDRLGEVLAEGSAALFADRILLEALARLKATDPAVFAARRATLKGWVSLRDLDEALKPYLRKQARERPPVLRAEAGCYRVEGGCICRERGTPDGGTALVPLGNFTARIVETVTRDDGAEQSSLFILAGALADGRELPPVQVPAADFDGMGWVTGAWHGEAVVYAGQGTRDHLRCALELLSGGRVRRTVYAHTGWRRVGEVWCYLHAGGAIGAGGPAAGVEADLPDALAGYALPHPPTGPGLTAAVRASLALLDGLAPDRIAFPLLGAIYRAALGEAPGPIDLSLHLAGPHGVGKSELAALGQQHHGAGLDARHLPGSWSSTGNALEGLAFACKDAVLVIDDWAPQGSAADVQRLRREADRVLRGQGNRAGRLRMRADGSLRPARPPRGLIVSTGEDVPPGQSLRGRLLVLEVSPGDVPLAHLTDHQRAAAAGLLAQALAGFVRWLAPRYGDLCGRLPGERAALRDRALAEAAPGSTRTPGIVADLAIGLNRFLDFARAVGAISPADRDALSRRGWQALLEAAARQAEHVRAAEPTALFLRLLVAALASGRAHVAGLDGREPQAPDAWGWRALERTYRGESGSIETEISWVAQGRRVGWVDGADLYLEPEASHAAAQEMARDQSEALPVSPQILRRRLKERGLLASWDGPRQRNTVRRTLEGVKDREVLHLRAGALSPCSEPPEPSAEAGKPQDSAEGWTVSADDSADGNGVCAGNRPQEPSAEAAENPPGGRCGRSETGGEGSPPENLAPPRRRRGSL